MTYGLFQYYTDELSGWNRVLEFHKEESGELVRKITVVLNQQAISSSHEKESGKFIDLFMVQHQEFDYITNQINSQQSRLEKTHVMPGEPVESPISQKQDSLRAKMQTIERNFLRAKYNCSVFLSSFLN